MKVSATLKGLSVLYITVALYSCTKPDINFGTNYADNNITNVVVVDTATAIISTVFQDSFITSGTGSALVGRYSDPYFGKVSAQSYFPIAPPTYSDIYAGTTYDSLELIVKPNKTFYGDTTLPIQINVLQLAEPIVFAENKFSLYNLNSFSTGQTLGSKTVVIRPSVTDSISIRLSDETGQKLLGLLQSNDDAIKSQTSFTDFFNGIKIAAGSNNAFMLGLKDSVIMRLHYKKDGLIKQANAVDFTVSDNTLQFNHIDIDRTGTALAGLSAANAEIPSSQTNNAGYLQSATGSLVKIRFPYLRGLLQASNYLKILKAELVIKPVKNSYNGYYPLPPYLRLSQTTQLNQIGADLTTLTSSGTATSMVGDLVIDDLYGENTDYVYDVTSYINLEIAEAGINQNGLLISPPNPNFMTTFNRLLLADKLHADGGIKLKLYYLTVNTNQ